MIMCTKLSTARIMNDACWDSWLQEPLEINPPPMLAPSVPGPLILATGSAQFQSTAIAQSTAAAKSTNAGTPATSDTSARPTLATTCTSTSTMPSTDPPQASKKKKKKKRQSQAASSPNKRTKKNAPSQTSPKKHTHTGPDSVRTYNERSVIHGPRYLRKNNIGGHPDRHGQPSRFYVRMVNPQPSKTPLKWNRRENNPGISVVGSLGCKDKPLLDFEKKRLMPLYDVSKKISITTPFTYMVMADELVELHKPYAQFVFGDPTTSQGSTVQFMYTKYSRTALSKKGSYYLQRLRNNPARGEPGTWLYKQARTWQAMAVRDTIKRYIGSTKWQRFRQVILCDESTTSRLYKRQGLTGGDVALRCQVLRQYVLRCYALKRLLTPDEERALVGDEQLLDDWVPKDSAYVHIYHKALQMQSSDGRAKVWQTDMKRLRSYVEAEIAEPGRQIYWMQLKARASALLPDDATRLVTNQQRWASSGIL